MSLRSRLITLVIVALSLSLACGGVVVLINAKRSVRNEMHAALEVGRQMVDAGLRDTDIRVGLRHYVNAVIAPLNGNRHLRVLVEGNGIATHIDPIRDRSSFGTEPGWFVRLIGVPSEAARVPLTIAGRSIGGIVIETDPTNEIHEVWNELCSGMLVLALFCALTIGLIYLFTGRALRPLDQLSRALEQVGHGAYEPLQIADKLTPELGGLCDSFNRMAARLAATDADNRRLAEQLANLQEEERTDLARDLHDEVGPLLFAIGVDVGTMTRLLDAGRNDELHAPLRSIAEAALQLQRHVRGMLGRLRPLGLAEIGLAEALNALVGFWRRRRAGIDFYCRVGANCNVLSGGAETTVYRIVQECLNNSVRHGRPTTIAISVDLNTGSDEVSVEVTDDGPGLLDKAAPGYGLIGMAERVRAAGGRLTFANRATGGLAVRAALPCTQARPEAVP
jgi:two-component system, NarL family, sensor histidine kinase UhpB